MLTSRYNNTEMDFGLQGIEFIIRNKVRFIVVLLCDLYEQLPALSGR
jgi:hypothetical protein